MEKTNILLIGMPGAGKTTVGKIISKQTGLPHIDTDRLIEAKAGMKLQEIIAEKGMSCFSAAEEEVLTELAPEHSVISTGGSAVCCEKGMEKLRSICTVVYLKADPAHLIANIRNMDTRGIAFGPGQSFEDLYNERCPLYEKYADITVLAGRESPGAVAANVMANLSLKRI